MVVSMRSGGSQEVDNLFVPMFRGKGKRGFAALICGVNIDAMLDEEFCGVAATPAHGDYERRVPGRG